MLKKILIETSEYIISIFKISSNNSNLNNKFIFLSFCLLEAATINHH